MFVWQKYIVPAWEIGRSVTGDATLIATAFFFLIIGFNVNNMK